MRMCAGTAYKPGLVITKLVKEKMGNRPTDQSVPAAVQDVWTVDRRSIPEELQEAGKPQPRNGEPCAVFHNDERAFVAQEFAYKKHIDNV